MKTAGYHMPQSIQNPHSQPGSFGESTGIEILSQAWATWIFLACYHTMNDINMVHYLANDDIYSS